MSRSAGARVEAAIAGVGAPPGDPAAVQAHLDALTKPPGSLGRLESLALQIGVVLGDPPPNFAAGGAAINVLTRGCGAEVRVVDVGVAADLAGMAGIEHRKVRPGTADLSEQPAMTGDEVVEAHCGARPRPLPRGRRRDGDRQHHCGCGGRGLPDGGGGVRRRRPRHRGRRCGACAEAGRGAGAGRRRRDRDHDREKIFVILKDSRVGAFGALALVVSVGFRLVLLAGLDAAAPAALIFAHCLARVGPVWLMAALPYILFTILAVRSIGS